MNLRNFAFKHFRKIGPGPIPRITNRANNGDLYELWYALCCFLFLELYDDALSPVCIIWRQMSVIIDDYLEHIYKGAAVAYFKVDLPTQACQQ
jgi:hypothetical protein